MKKKLLSSKWLRFLTIAVIVLLVIVFLMIGVGMIKFNILNDDIYVPLADGSTIPMNNIERSVRSRFTCMDGFTGKVDYVFLKDNTEKTFLIFPNKVFELEHVRSGSGVKYANQDESVVFWKKKNQALIIENGTITHKACDIFVQAQE